MSYEKILVPYDTSEDSKKALITAMELLEHGLANYIVVLHVAQEYRGGDYWIPAGEMASGAGPMPYSQEEYDALVDEISAQTSRIEGKVEIMAHTGIPKDEILSVAEDKKCGLIVMGSRGLGAIRGMLGSVSYAVLRDSEVPVLITKQGKSS